MADVFLSYTHSERDRLIPLVTRLTLLGLSVWFDVRIPTGTSYEEVIASELESAKSVVVCWSQSSIKSKWVRSEAAFALDQGHLVPCFLERCVLKPPFNMTQTEDISEWNGDIEFPAWRKLVERIGSLVERPGLLELMDALNEPVGERLRAWAARFPKDPYCTQAVKLWEHKQREDFAREIEIATAQLDRAVKRQVAKGKAKLLALSSAMDQWVSLGIEAQDADRPRPSRLILSIVEKNVDGHMVDREVLADALDKAKSAREEATRLDHENAILRSQIDELSRHGMVTEERLNNSTEEMHLRFERTAETTRNKSRVVLGACLAMVLIFSGLSGFLIIERSQWIVKLEQSASEVSEEHRIAEASLSDLRRQIVQLSADQSTTAAQRDAAVHQVADVQAQILKLKAERTSPNASLLRPALTADQTLPLMTHPASDATACTRYAGSVFDRDNLTGEGVFDMSSLDASTLRETVASCTRALDGVTDDRLRRRLLTQLGRAEVNSAIASKKAGDERASENDIKSALHHLQMADQKGSAYAISILGTVYQGIAGLEAGDRDAFGPTDRNQAIKFYQRAADLGDPSAMTNLARMLLDGNFPGDFDESYIINLLKRAEALRYPRAFELHANAWLDLRMYGSSSSADRRRNAATLLGQEQCFGFKDEVDRAFNKSPLLASYRNIGSCT